MHPTESDEFTQADDGALVRQGEFLGVRILLLSDLGRPGQERLLESAPDLRADVVVSGISTQTEPLCDALLDAIRPRLIIIADSELPATARASERLKARLALRNATAIYTREAGAVTISFRAKDCEIRTASNQCFKLESLPEMALTPPSHELAK